MVALQVEKILPLSLSDLDRSGAVPLFFQVSQRIENAIVSGDLNVGSRLESETALCARLGLSRPTIRRAIQEVVDKGMLVRRRGIGTQVVHGQLARNVEIGSLFDDLALSAKSPTTEVIACEEVEAVAQVTSKLGVELGSPLLYIRRLRFANDEPVAVMENWLPGEFRDITCADLVQQGLYRVLQSRRVRMRVAKQRIGARQATSDEAALLGLDTGSALLTMQRVAHDDSGRAVEYGQHCYRPDRHSFEVTVVER